MPPGYGQPPRPRRRLLTGAVTYIAVAAMAAAAGGLVVAFADGGSQQPSASSGTGNFPNNGAGNPFGGLGNGGGPNAGANVSQGTLRHVESAVKPGLVVITSSLKFDGSGAAAAATGMVISKSGLVLTNNHVINGTTGLTATVVSTGQHYQAKWLGYDKGSDIAVIQLVGTSGLDNSTGWRLLDGQSRKCRHRHGQRRRDREHHLGCRHYHRAESVDLRER